MNPDNDSCLWLLVVWVCCLGVIAWIAISAVTAK